MKMVSLRVEALLFTAMVLLEIGDVVMASLTKAALTSQMSSGVYVVYYNSLGTLILFIYFIFQIPRSGRKPLTSTLLCKFFLLSFLGKQRTAIMQDFHSANCWMRGACIQLSPALASAMGNLIPAFTFLLAVIFRMERLTLNSTSHQAKIIGTIVSISGAFIVTLYKGPAILKISSPSNLFTTHKSNWIVAGLLFTLTTLSFSTWSILQAAILKEYPKKIALVFFCSLFGTIQCALFSLMVERSSSVWTLQHGIQITAVIFSGVYGSAIRKSIIAWGLQKKGPVYVALFKPLATAIAGVTSVMFLGETPHLGSMIGAVTIAVGFYTVMWGKAKEKDITTQNHLCISEPNSSCIRLLQDN